MRCESEPLPPPMICRLAVDSSTSSMYFPWVWNCGVSISLPSMPIHSRPPKDIRYRIVIMQMMTNPRMEYHWSKWTMLHEKCELISTFKSVSFETKYSRPYGSHHQQHVCAYHQ